jgi:hypothetical protein
VRRATRVVAPSPDPTPVREPAESPRASEAFWVASVVFVVNLAVALYLSYRVQYVEGDALSRVADAYYVIFSRDPHLGAIGMVWNPLPSLMVLPLVLLKPLVPALVTRGLAGCILTAVFGAVGVAQLAGIMAGLGIERRWRIVAVAVYAANPLILLYSSNGMSDIILMTSYLGAVRGVLAYLDTRSLRPLVSAALWLVIGFGARYEAVPFAVFLIFGVVYAVYQTRTLPEAESAAVLLAAPLVYGAGVWIYFNWLIMKNPLYFLTSPYGNISQTATGAYTTPALAWAYHNVLNTLLYTAHFSLLYWPVWVGIGGAVYWLVRKGARDVRGGILLAALAGALVLEVAFTYRGSIASWDRFYMSYIPLGFVMVAFTASHVRTELKVPGSWVVYAMVVLLALGDIGTWQALQVPFLGDPSGPVVDHAVAGTSLPPSVSEWGRTVLFRFTQSPVALYIDRHPNLRVLVDTFDSYQVVLQAKNPKQFVITSDEDFAAVLHNPLGQVNAILAPRPLDVHKLNAINFTYPRLWRGGVSWTYLIKSFNDEQQMRLYGLKPNAP